INDQPTDDPAKDQCAGLYRSCESRFGAGNQLPFGGFPAVSIIARS
ncbi:phage tail protein, partial [Pseudomonas aeruginosa]